MPTVMSASLFGRSGSSAFRLSTNSVSTSHLQKGSIDLQPDIDEWHKGMAKRSVGLDWLSNSPIEGTMTKAGHQLDTEDLQQPAARCLDR
jgi:hypothetical protein